MSHKWAYKTLTIEEKIKVLKEINQNKCYTISSEKYGIERSTIHDIKRKEVKLKGYYCNMKEMWMVREVKLMKCGKDIVKFVANCEQGNDARNNDDDDVCDGGQGSEPCQVSHAEAVLCISKLLTWLEKQDERTV